MAVTKVTSSMEARLTGLTTYYLSARYTSSGACTECQRILNETTHAVDLVMGKRKQVRTQPRKALSRAA